MRQVIELLAASIAAAALGCGGGSSQTRDDDEPPGARADVSFAAADGVSLTGYLVGGTAAPAGAPGVLLLHQFTQTDEQWGDLPETLAARGYRVLAFNMRGHGDSDPYDGDLVGLLDDAVAAPADVDAGLAYLRGPGQADPDRIAIVGTSIGANLAVAASVAGKAKTYVSFSSRTTKVANYAGADATGMRSVFYLAGESEGANQASDAEAMFEATAEPRQIKIYAGTADHGIAILDNHSDSRDLLSSWLDANL